MKRLLQIVLLVLITSFFACKKDREVNVESVKISKETATPTAVKANIDGSYIYSGKIKKISIEFDKKSDLSEAVSVDASVSGNNFSATLTGLKALTLYYYCVKIDYGYGVFTSETRNFTTEDYKLPVVITAAVTDVQANTAKCGGQITDDGEAQVTARGVCWSKNQNPTTADACTSDGTGTGTFTSEVTDLTINTKYYLRAYASNVKGTAYGEQFEFITQNGVVTVNTKAVTNIGGNSAVCGGTINSDGGFSITSRGVCWSKTPNPEVSGQHTSDGSGTGSYNSTISGLEPLTKYYVRAYAVNSIGTFYGEEKSFTTINDGSATLSTNTVTDITSTTAACGGYISSDGGYAITARGVCWSTTNNPSVSGSHTGDGSGIGSFTSSITGLTPNTTYYVRAYATNSQKTSYGDEKTFTTNPEGVPVLTTNEIININKTFATCGGNITSSGSSSVTARGVCWSTDLNPDISDTHTSDGSGTGSFTSSITDLTANTTYYVRSYATNAQGIGYGEIRYFTTLAEGAPTVITSEITEITTTSAVCGGDVTSNGGFEVTSRGVCWSISQNPTVSDLHTSDGSGTGSFTSNITDLTPSTSYYVRAYAINANGTTYGEQKLLNTASGSLATVTTAEVTDITSVTATGGGDVSSDGGLEVTSRGVCWSTEQGPNLDDSYTNDGSGTGSFTSSISDLQPNTTYYVRAYAVNSKGTAFGGQKSFTTEAALPSVTTAEISNVTINAASCGGNVTDGGGLTVTERGVCWSTSSNPTYSDSHTSDGSGLGNFTSSITGLMPNTAYYVRAYAKNSQGCNYGEEKTFTTNQGDLPSLTTDEITAVTANTATSGGNITSDGGYPVSSRGVCWSISQNPTVSDSHTSDGSGTGSFTSSLTGLTPNTTYYVRAYAVNNQGTAYGEQRIFSTSSGVATVITSGVTAITAVSAVCGGNVTYDGGSEVTSRGVCWSTNQNPTVSDIHTTNGSGLGEFTSSITGLSVNTTYYVRAYATNAIGTYYGEQKSFATLSGLASVSTASITEITSNSAVCGGNVSDDCGFVVTVKGVCWSTSQNPTTADSHTTDGGGLGNFTSTISDLAEVTTYYVRAYATNVNGTAYGEQRSFSTFLVIGTFSVSSTEQVQFSQGNLQYQASTNTWRFGENQYDCIGSENSNISPTYSGWIDLFGWGTSGWNCGNTYYQPYNSNNSNGSLYGPPGSYNLTGSYANSDWGVYNAISNGGNQPGMWRTLSKDEWVYLINTRALAVNLRSQATVNSVTGLVILPDDWVQPAGVSFTGSANNWTTNTYTTEQWEIMQSAGAVFLPAAGYRNGTSVYDVGSGGYYWSSSYNYSNSAYYLYFYSGYVNLSYNFDRYYGPSVRLVKDLSGAKR